MTGSALAKDFAVQDRAAWRALAGKALKGADFEQALVSKTLDGIRIEPLYGASEAPSQAFPAALVPRLDGQPPWRIVTASLGDDPAAANRDFLADLAGGASAIELRLAAPGLAGLPARHDAIRTALAGVHLEMVPVSLSAGDQYLGALQSLHALWDEQGIEGARRLGALNADPLGTLARTGALEAELWGAIDVMGHVAAQNLGLSPNVTLLLADGRPYHDAGASEAEELAATIATLVEYLRALEREGVSPADGLPKIAVALASDCDFFLSIAKLRALRRLIGRLARACGAGPAAAQVRLHVETSRRMLSTLDPHVNLLRATVATAAAALAGAQSIHVLPFTAALGVPGPDARRIARNTQIVLMEESSLGRVADPAGGSYTLDRIGAELAAKAWAIFQEIERMGGMADALVSGAVGERIARTADARSKLVATLELPLTGVSAFPDRDATASSVLPHPRPAPIERAATRMPALPLRRPAEPFEVLRARAAAIARHDGKRPIVALVCLGSRDDDAARAEFAASLFAVGGIETLAIRATESGLEATLAQSGAGIACLCSSDATYLREAEIAARALKAAGMRLVILAGRPGERRAAYDAAGVGLYIHRGADVPAALAVVLDHLEAAV